MKNAQIILSIVIVAIIAYPIFLLGEEVGAIIANNPLKGILIVLTVALLSMGAYFFGVKIGRKYKSKFIKK